MAYSIVVIGTSWGGLAALTTLLGDLPEDFSVPVAVVQHRSKDSDQLFGRLLQDSTALKVCEVEDKDSLSPGTGKVVNTYFHLKILIHRGISPAKTHHFIVDGFHNFCFLF